MRFTGNKAAVRKVLAAFVVMFALGMAYCARAAESPEGLSIGIGQVTIGGDRCSFESFMLGQEFASGRGLAVLWTHGAGQCRGEHVSANMGAGAMRLSHLGRWSLGIGAGVQHHGDIATGPESLGGQEPPRTADRLQFCANLLVRRRIAERFVVDILHCSTGGSAPFNPGKNLVVFGIRF